MASLPRFSAIFMTSKHLKNSSFLFLYYLLMGASQYYLMSAPELYLG